MPESVGGHAGRAGTGKAGADSLPGLRTCVRCDHDGHEEGHQGDNAGGHCPCVVLVCPVPAGVHPGVGGSGQES